MITLVMAYFNNGGMLERHIAEWRRYRNAQDLRVILVDDCSLSDPAMPHIGDCPVDLQLYRIHTDRPWNQDGARNLGMTHAAEGWCLLTDMDHLLHTDQWDSLRATLADLNPSRTYRLSRQLHDGTVYKPHPNTWLMTRKAYWDMGGYDERYCGYYGSDGIFGRAMEAKHGKVETLPIPLTLYKREVQPDASTTQYGRKGSMYHLTMERAKKMTNTVPTLNFQWERLR